MSASDQKLWKAVQRGCLLICSEIERSGTTDLIWLSVRRGLMIICGAIAENVE